MHTYLAHHGILGQKWGVRRFQNPDGTLTDAGQKRYGRSEKTTKRVRNVGIATAIGGAAAAGALNSRQSSRYLTKLADLTGKSYAAALLSGDESAMQKAGDFAREVLDGTSDEKRSVFRLLTNQAVQEFEEFNDTMYTSASAFKATSETSLFAAKALRTFNSYAPILQTASTALGMVGLGMTAVSLGISGYKLAKNAYDKHKQKKAAGHVEHGINHDGRTVYDVFGTLSGDKQTVACMMVAMAAYKDLANNPTKYAKPDPSNTKQFIDVNKVWSTFTDEERNSVLAVMQAFN